MSIETMEWIVVRVLWVAAVATTAFPILYTVVARWYTTREGRAVFFFATSTMVLIDLTLAFYYFPPTSIAVSFWSQLAAWAFAACTALYQVFAMLRAQRTLSPRRERRVH